MPSLRISIGDTYRILGRIGIRRYRRYVSGVSGIDRKTGKVLVLRHGPISAAFFFAEEDVVRDSIFVLPCSNYLLHLPFYISQNSSYRPYEPSFGPLFRSSIPRGEILRKRHEYIGANGSQDVPLAV
jgi:hypothetical protein